MSILDALFGKTIYEKRKNLPRVIYATVAVFLVLAVILAFALAASTDDGIEDDSNKPSETVTNKTLNCSFSETKTGNLLVVNKNSKAYDFEVNPESNLVLMSTVLPSVDGSSLYSLQKDGMLADKEALDALNEMIKDFYEQADDKEAAKKLSVRSAYRTYAEQSGYATPAGHSDFHTGMLFELTVGATMTSISTDDIFDWIYENSHKYGFIERYPESKSGETGVSDFDNAFRYVGTPHSTYIKENGLSLEGYVKLIKTSEKPISISGYKVFYLPANTDGNTEITVTSRTYKISGDNNGGFIVTTK